MTRFRCRQRLITGGEQGKGKKTRFVPRSLVQGMMEGPRERERGIQQYCVKREMGGRRGSKQANT